MGGAPRGATESVEAVVIARQDHGEADRVVRWLCAERGRGAGIARGARRANSRFGAALEPTQHVRLLLRRRGGGLDVIEDAELLDPHTRTRDDLDRLALAAHATELIAGLAREEQPEPRLFGLLQTALLLIDASSAAPGDAMRLGLEAKALTFAGLLAPLDRCARCGEAAELGRAWAVHPHTGAAGHPGCVGSDGECTGAFALALEGARRRPLRETLDLPAPEGPHWVLCGVIEAHIGRALRARSMLAPTPIVQPTAAIR